MKRSHQWSGDSGPRRIVIVTGSDTEVGKTVLTSLLTQRLRAEGVNAVALKPLCSGGRADAVALHEATGGALTLDEVNPWHFRAALAPVLAARREGRGVTLAEVAAQVRAVASRFELVLVEGAGGLLSPLGEDFDTRDLVVALRAIPIVVVPNRLGAVNQARLVLEALPKSLRKRAAVVLVDQALRDAAARTNAALLAEFARGHVIARLLWMNMADGPRLNRSASAGLNALLAALRD